MIMKRILILAFKDLRLITRDKFGMFFMLAFPVMMALFFGSIMRFEQSESQSMKVAITDLDQSEQSRQFAAGLQENKAIDLQTLDRETAVNSVRRGKHVAVIILPKDFGKTAGVFWETAPAIELGVDPSRTAEAGLLQGLVMQAMGKLTMSRFQDPGSLRPLIDDTRQKFLEDESISADMRPLLGDLMDSLSNMFQSIQDVQTSSGPDGDSVSDGGKAADGFGGFQMANVQQIDVSREIDPKSLSGVLRNVRSGWDISFPQAMVWSVLGCVAGFATLMVREQTLGTQTRLLVAPVTRPQLLVGKGVACFLCLLMVLSAMIAIAVILGMRPRRWDLLALAIVSISVCFVGLMLPLSLIGRTEQSVSGAVWGICTVLAMFGGGMIPVFFMPSFIQELSNYNPVKWAVYSMEGAIWRGFTFQEMLLPCGILVAVGLVALCLGSWMISRRQ